LSKGFFTTIGLLTVLVEAILLNIFQIKVKKRQVLPFWWQNSGGEASLLDF
jgi:hypothetical protein